LSDFFITQGKQIEKMTYPQYDQPIGQLIHNFLYEKYDLSPEVQTLIYFSEFVKDKEKIQKDLELGKILISDRYFTSTLVYQGLRGVDLNKIISLSDLFNIPKPDLCIYLRISPETSMKRKSSEKQGDLDRNEKDLEFLRNLVNMYDRIAKDNLFCKWEIVDGEKPIQEVYNQIIKII